MIETSSLAKEECYKCGIIFGVSPNYQKNRLKDKESFYCPNGHSQAYIESTEEKLRKTIEMKDRQISFRDSEVQRLERELKKKCKSKNK